MLINSRAYKVLSLIRRSFSSSLDIRAKKTLSPSSSISTYLRLTDMEATSYQGLHVARRNSATFYKVYFE